MNEHALEKRLPRWGLTRWLIDPGADVPLSIRVSLIDSLYGSIPIFIGGVLNTLAVSAFIAGTIPTPLFVGWALFEVVLAVLRLPILIAGRRASIEGTRGPIDLYILLAILWSVSVGFGAFISIWSGNWVVATLGTLSSAAMVGGICFRNFAAPRLVWLMIFTSFGPIAIAGITSGEPLMMVTGFQIPIYLYAMTVAASRMNRMMVRTMQAELENDHRARHDPLTGLLNRDGLAASMDDRPADEPIACFFIDLDGFKRVNDTLGHKAGDLLLGLVAKRLRSAASAEAILARIGGDEFVVIEPCADAAVARTRGETIAAHLAGMPYIVDEQGVLIGACVGAALRNPETVTLDALIAAADEALYQAKASGPAACVVADVPRGASNTGLRIAHG